MPSRLISGLIRWGALLCVPGGMLWALSPLGVHLSQWRYATPAVFWQLFPSAVLLLMAGAIGLHFWQLGRSGLLGRVGLTVVLVGGALTIVGDVGKFWLGVDDAYMMAAPAYRTMRAGLFLFATGAVVFGTAALRYGTLPRWGALPFAVGGLCGMVAVSSDLGVFGAGLWVLFGVGWAWMGLAPLLVAVSSWIGNRRKKAVG